MTDIIAHTMEYKGGLVQPHVSLIHYSDDHFYEYKRVYEDCFHAMRMALGLNPVDACDSREELLEKRNDIYVYIENGVFIGSVAIYKNEIDDLIVARDYQRKGYGEMMLHFAITRMQEANTDPIILHVADWNKQAIKLYLK